MKNTRHISFLTVCFTAVIVLSTSCLMKNDLAYPDVRAVITEFEVKGQSSAKIDPAAQKISVILKEDTDIRYQKITKFKYTPLSVDKDTTRMNPYVKVGDTLDLSNPFNLKFTVYFRDSIWTIVTSQPIERYIKAQGMLDSAVFVPETLTATVSIIDTVNLRNVTVDDMKLGQKGSKIVSTVGYEMEGDQRVRKERSCEFPMTLDCENERIFKSVYKKDTSEWKVTFNSVHVNVRIKSVNAWTERASVDAMFDGKGTPLLEYAEGGSKEWNKISNIIVSGTSVKGFINDLSEGTDYQVRVSSSGETSSEYSFTTEKKNQIQNMGFDEWMVDDNGADVPSPGDRVWGTPNPGSILLQVEVTYPEETFLAVGGSGKKAAKMETKWVGVPGVAGSLSGGTIFSGAFGGRDGFGAKFIWGTSFVTRPKTLKGYFAYDPKKIDYYTEESAAWAGKTDSLQILVILADWNEPYTVNFVKGQYLEDDDPGIIAKGTFQTSQRTPATGALEYSKFEFPIEYRDTVRKPKWAVVLTSSSYRSDHFCGASGSTLYVDEMEFTY